MIILTSRGVCRDPQTQKHAVRSLAINCVAHYIYTLAEGICITAINSPVKGIYMYDDEVG